MHSPTSHYPSSKSGSSSVKIFPGLPGLLRLLGLPAVLLEPLWLHGLLGLFASPWFPLDSLTLYYTRLKTTFTFGVSILPGVPSNFFSINFQYPRKNVDSNSTFITTSLIRKNLTYLHSIKAYKHTSNDAHDVSLWRVSRYQEQWIHCYVWTITFIT